jgi:hypothetical protein
MFLLYMPQWVVRDYISAQGRNVIQEWMAKDLTPKDRQRLNERLAEIETRRSDKDELPPEWLKKYHSAPGLFEVKVKGDRKELRPLSIKRGGEIVLLAGAIKKGKISEGDVKKAQNNMENLKKGIGHVEDHFGENE